MNPECMLELKPWRAVIIVHLVTLASFVVWSLHLVAEESKAPVLIVRAHMYFFV